MAIISTERFVEIATSAELMRKFGSAMSQLPGQTRWINHWSASTTPAPVADRDTALAVYRQVKDSISSGQSQNKGARPWYFYPDAFTHLDRSEPWWGFEFECGFKTAAARQKVLTHVWDTWDGVTFDGEGEGNYRSEITFMPSEASKFSKGTAPAQQFMKYLCASGTTHRTRQSSVGTHLNISHPLLNTKNVGWAECFLNNTLSFLHPDDKLFLFGRRSLYDGAYAQQSDRAGRKKNVWIELKTFRTTYDWKQWLQYIRTCHAITAILHHYLEAEDKASLRCKGVSNLLAMVKKKAAIKIKPVAEATGDQQFYDY